MISPHVVAYYWVSKPGTDLLAKMFSYSMNVLSTTQGQANFSMEFATYRQVSASQQIVLMEKAK